MKELPTTITLPVTDAILCFKISRHGYMLHVSRTKFVLKLGLVREVVERSWTILYNKWTRALHRTLF